MQKIIDELARKLETGELKCRDGVIFNPKEVDEELYDCEHDNYYKDCP